jgi:hypothetical protein
MLCVRADIEKIHFDTEKGHWDDKNFQDNDAMKGPVGQPKDFD